MWELFPNDGEMERYNGHNRKRERLIGLFAISLKMSCCRQTKIRFQFSVFFLSECPLIVSMNFSPYPFSREVVISKRWFGHHELDKAQGRGIPRSPDEMNFEVISNIFSIFSQTLWTDWQTDGGTGQSRFKDVLAQRENVARPQQGFLPVCSSIFWLVHW